MEAFPWGAPFHLHLLLRRIIAEAFRAGNLSPPGALGMVVRRMCRFWIARLIPPFDLCSEATQALLDALIAPIDLADVLDRAGAFGC